MPLDVQVLSVASTEMYPSVIVTGETQRYLFNAGEGLQRLCMEHRVRLGKMHHVCLTELNSSTTGGLPGLILTVSDTGKKGLNVMGPTGTKAFMRATRHFLYRPNFAMEVDDLTTSSPPIVQDDTMTMRAVVVDDAGFNSSSKASTSADSPNKRTKVSGPTTTSVSYIGETPTQRGKFLIQKALALGVPKGPLCGALHRGEDVTIQVHGEDVVVKSVDCVSPSSPGTAFAIVACPTVATVGSLVEAPQFKPYRNDGDGVKMALLVHLGKLEVLAHPTYVQWVQSFGSHVQHVLVNHVECPKWTVFRSSATLQAQLHHVFPSNYAAPHHEIAPATSVALDFGSATIGQSMLKFTLVPVAKQGFDRSACFQPLDLETIRLETQKTLSDANVSLTAESDASSLPLPDNDTTTGRVTFLGTGSALPSKYRNVTSNVVEFGSSVLLLDSGEGCYGQLFRYVEGDKTRLDTLMKNLHVVWISHNHADHHLGLIRLLSERSLSLPPLMVIGPTPVFYWLEDYGKADASIVGKYIFENNLTFDVTSTSDEDDLHPFGTHKAAMQKALATHYDIASFECVPVKHCHMSYAVVLTTSNGFKLVFSGDCRPSDLLVQYSQGADVLIHEATFEESMVEEAKKKDHSTTEEAIDVGLQANAKHILLTHFSQRYPKMPNLTPETLERVMTGLDLMSLPFHALHVPNMMLACQALMPSGNDVVEDDA
ncbi:Aste57867_5068 [Aphanomyces stellatus]|uniref:ribonuclease Z n=1 Tax=Aphanomyces stellatus TaxID=120398 RepID=A0A485KDS7_9STRA|nr:hypothetical protein As57867_005055 [Aphanomyces stellatus]VFT82149.1 Aste57867_5068 [Aphanomyces stellatus]